MSLKELEIQNSYISYGENNIVDALVAPALKKAQRYRRSVGYFSSSVFTRISQEIIEFVQRGGKIELICGIELSFEDKNAIEMGYKKRSALTIDKFGGNFQEQIEELDDECLQLLEELIAKEFMDIKIALTKGFGIYHDKLGIFDDEYNNTLVFYGSANSTGSAYSENYEKIRIAVSWKEGFDEIVNDEVREFESLWNATNPFVDVFTFSEKANEIIVNEKNKRKKAKTGNQGIILRDYQEEAIQAWKNNDYHGFYVMATGTGKTWTAIYSAMELLKQCKALIVICAPYKHLIKQWREDIIKVFPRAKIIMVSSENPGWVEQINNAAISSKYNQEEQTIIISTIKSFATEKFDKIISKFTLNKLLIVDEAHRFKKFDLNTDKIRYQYLLGLSATPGNGKNKEFADQLMDFFGGKVFDLPIEVALERKYLVPYNYIPIFVNASIDEEKKFDDYSGKMAACYKNGVCVDPDGLALLSRARLRVIAMAEEKMEQIGYILDQIDEPDHFVIYCGDGKVFDDYKNDDVKHIQFIKSVLDKREKKACQFTASENMDKRMELVEGFNKREFDTLVAIRCLDEGINIPSIKAALILASNDDYREFVQRRGRILRTYYDKLIANIYDVIVLPSRECKSWATIEMRRFYEYSRLSQNQHINKYTFDSLMNEYNLDIDEVCKFMEVEDEIDE